MKKVVSALNLKGELCRTLDGQYFFRTYKNKKTVDYFLSHSELMVQILDPDAYIYEKNGELYIDHSPQVLGSELDYD